MLLQHGILHGIHLVRDPLFIGGKAEGGRGQGATTGHDEDAILGFPGNVFLQACLHLREMLISVPCHWPYISIGASVFKMGLSIANCSIKNYIK